MILLEKNNFRKFHLFLYFWTISKNFFHTFGRTFIGCVNETALYSFGEFLKDRNFFTRKKFSHQFLTLSWWFTGLCRETSVSHQSCNLRVRRNILPKHCVGKKSSTLLHFQQKNSLNFGERLLTWLSKLPSTCSQELFEGRKKGEKSDFNSIFYFGKEIFKLLPESSQQSCQNSILVSRGWIPWKKLFLEVPNSPIFPYFEHNFSDCKR